MMNSKGQKALVYTGWDIPEDTGAWSASPGCMGGEWTLLKWRKKDGNG